MADNDMGMLSQADLDALIAGATENAEETEEMGFGGLGLDEESMEPEPPPALRSAPGGLVDLPSFDAPASTPLAADDAGGMGRVRDIPLEVTVELGRTRLLIRDILDLAPGSIIELDKIAGEPVELFANGLLVARGEVIVIDDNFGVRVTEIITAVRRGADKENHALAA